MARIKYVTKKDIEHAEKCLLSEVETYNHFLTGEVYGYEVEDAEGNELDSCWGFYGDAGKKDMIEEAKGQIDYLRSVSNYQI